MFWGGRAVGWSSEHGGEEKGGGGGVSSGGLTNYPAGLRLQHHTSSVSALPLLEPTRNAAKGTVSMATPLCSASHLDCRLKPLDIRNSIERKEERLTTNAGA